MEVVDAQFKVRRELSEQFAARAQHCRGRQRGRRLLTDAEGDGGRFNVAEPVGEPQRFYLGTDHRKQWDGRPHPLTASAV
ncbi:MAG: hypothetical protein M0038_10325, partial [Pseudomonadota bacterium]|nr:hypothetical protein [Pseudomonadota bacterium]